jgi:hypothetical protein
MGASQGESRDESSNPHKEEETTNHPIIEKFQLIAMYTSAVPRCCLTESVQITLPTDPQ